MNSAPQLLTNNPIKTGSGYLIPIDFLSLVTINVSRVFVLTDVKDSKRGNHAHKIAKQALQVTSGQIRCYIENIHGIKFDFVLSPNTGILLVDSLHWLEILFEIDSTVLVLTDQPFSEGDYIRDKSLFYELGKDKCES